MILLINLLTGRTEYNIYCRKSLFHQCVNLSQVLTKRFFQNNIPFIKHIHPFQITHQCYRSLWHVRTLYNIVFHNSDNRTKVIFAIFQILTDGTIRPTNLTNHLFINQDLFILLDIPAFYNLKSHNRNIMFINKFDTSHKFLPMCICVRLTHVATINNRTCITKLLNYGQSSENTVHFISFSIWRPPNCQIIDLISHVTGHHLMIL